MQNWHSVEVSGGLIRRGAQVYATVSSTSTCSPFGYRGRGSLVQQLWDAKSSRVIATRTPHRRDRRINSGTHHGISGLRVSLSKIRYSRCGPPLFPHVSVLIMLVSTCRKIWSIFWLFQIKGTNDVLLTWKAKYPGFLFFAFSFNNRGEWNYD